MNLISSKKITSHESKVREDAEGKSLAKTIIIYHYILYTIVII